MSTIPALPRWDMSVVFPSLESPEFAQAFTTVIQDIQHLRLFFDLIGIKELSAPPPVDDALVQTFETAIARYNLLLDSLRTVNAYINCFITTNSHDALAQARMSELQQALVQVSQLSIRLTAWFGALDFEALQARSQVAQDHAYVLLHSKIQAAHLLSPAEEELASELNVSGGTAWARLHGNISSQLLVPFALQGEPQELPMSVIRNLAFEADRDLRRRAYEAELEGWQRVSVPLAAAFNSIKHEVNILTHKRRWSSPLEASLFSNSIDQATFDAMLSAAYNSFPDFRRYLHAKARYLHLERLAWYDLFAPLSSSDKNWSFAEATTFIVEQFATYSPRLSNFAARAFREQWIDAEPRSGKRDGAYCTALRGDESRVFANFKPAFGGVSTLAHELGHGYHNLNLAQRSMLQRSHPMTLAETASIFCETIIRHAALKDADKHEQLTILEASLQGSCQVVVDIISRFLFEQRVFEKRQKRELSVAELNALMLETQRETYGDGLDDAILHPYMWAVKTHYYSSSRSFYNYPYMFGLLFGLGLYARYQQEPERFKQGYDDLLSATGMADAATLAARFGIDLRTEAFWQSSLDIIRQDITQFEALI